MSCRQSHVPIKSNFSLLSRWSHNYWQWHFPQIIKIGKNIEHPPTNNYDGAKILILQINTLCRKACWQTGIPKRNHAMAKKRGWGELQFSTKSDLKVANAWRNIPFPFKWKDTFKNLSKFFDTFVSLYVPYLHFC